MSSLKKALTNLKIKPGSSSQPQSDEDASSPRTSRSPGPAARASTTSNSGPRTSMHSDRERTKSPTGNASPRNSAVFGRSSGTFSRSSLGGGFRDSHHGHTVSHSPIRAFRDKLGFGEDSSDDTDKPLNRDGEPMSKNQIKRSEKQAENEVRQKEREEKEAELEAKRKQRMENADKDETPEQKKRYGYLPVNYYAGDLRNENRVNILSLSAQDVGKEVFFRARVHHLRKMSAHLLFLVFRQQTTTIQGVLQEQGDISEYFLYWAEHLEVESVVCIKGIVQDPKAKQGEVAGTTIHDVEIAIQELHVEGKVSETLPFSVNEAEVTKAEAEDENDTRVKVTDRTRLANRIIDLRSTTSQAIFRVQSGVCNLFRSYLDTQGFIEIHTPKLQGGATESGSSVFKLDYFNRPGFLAQSPQLAKQMSISADFGRVYEVGPVFRAENSNTHRHLTEFTGLDLEMQIDEHYHEILRMLDRTFKHIFKGIYERYRHEIDVVKRMFPHEDLVWLEETPIIPFAEGIKMLNDSGWRDDEGKPLPENEDLGTRDEIQLGRVIKEKLGTDYYILDKFPASARPFYAMNDPYNEEVTNSFDIFVRGQEILSGGQRIHDAQTLLGKMERMKMDPNSMEEYIQGFEWGCPPHGGGGIGLERILMLMLALGDIRHASMYPRDPRSLPAKSPVRQLRHPEASTMHPPWQGYDRMNAQIDLQPLEKLIANYGDATNTSWLEPRTQVWRDENTGAAVGFVPQDGFAIIVGDPLCHQQQYTKIITAFLRHIKTQTKLKPLWLLVGEPVEQVLANRFNWRTFSVVSEQRLDPSNNKAFGDHELQRKVRHAEKEGIKINDYPMGSPPPQELKEKIDKRIQDWLKGRKGKQVHLTDVHPWQDEAHRQYHVAQDKDGVVHAVVIMAQLSPDHGWQVKFALDLPGSTSGTIEMIVIHALKTVAGAGCTSVTFGGGASGKFKPGHNLKKTRVKVLSRAYNAIVTELKLTNKSEFREKLGAQEDPSYICYPPHGLGPMAVKSILNFFEDDDS